MGYGWFPDIAADSYGGLHIVWSTGKTIPAVGGGTLLATPAPDEFDVVMYTTSVNGINWSAPDDIAAMASGGEVTRPSLLIDPGGVLRITYREVGIFYSEAPLDGSISARTMQSPKVVSEKQVAYFSRMAMDSKGVIHLVYTENVPSPSCPICYHVFYRQSVDGGKTWSLRLDISQNNIGSAKPQFIIDKKDNLHVVWEAGVGGAYGQLDDPSSVMYATSHDGGKTWSKPYKFSSPNNWARNITIGEDGQGNLVVAWLAPDEDQIYYQISYNHGLTWSNPEAIPNVWGGWSVYNARLDDYTMATDSDGNLHLVFVGRLSADDKNLEILHLTWNGSTWSKPDFITRLVGDVPEWPRLTVSLGNQLNVVWFVRGQTHIWDSDSTHYRIWYSHLITQTAALTPVPSPTPAPDIISTSVPTPTVLPTATQIPPQLAAALHSPMTNFSIYSEYGNMLLMAKSLLPGILLLGLVFIVVRIRRH